MKYKNESSFWNDQKNIKWFNNYPPSDYWVKFLKRIKNRSAKKALDLGCGAGRHTKLLQKLGFEVFACDRHLGMVSQTQNIMRSFDWSDKKLKKQITKQSIDKLDYKGGFFDFVICHGVYHNAFNLKMLQKAIAESSRILKKDGVLLFNLFTNEFLPEDLSFVDKKNCLYLTKEGLRMLLISPDNFLDIARNNNLIPLSKRCLVRYQSEISTGKRSVFRGILTKR